MKHFLKLFVLTCLGPLMAACGSDDPDDNNSSSLTVTTPVVSDVTATTAVVKATAAGSAITSRGVCYGTSANPTIADSKVTGTSKDMTLTLAGLAPSTTYHVRTFAQTSNDLAYSADITFTTTEEQPTTSADLDNWTAPTYVDDYRNMADWNQRARWNLANVHDPTVMLAEDGYYYMYQTDASFGNSHSGHGHFMCRRSTNLVDWEFMGATMQALPSWVSVKLNEIRSAMGLGASTTNYNNCGYWAPCARKVRNGLYRMYYVITIDGTIDGTNNTWGERAFIGLMETATPGDVNSWVDKGYVLTNYSDRELNFRVSPTSWQQCYYKYNAIDPSYIITPEGEHWLIYGSWHSGFAAVQLNAETGKPVTDPLPNPWGSANEAAYGKRVFTRENGNRWQGSEAPEVVYHDGYYYLFMAYDGLDVPYNTRVVRSTKIDGPYMTISGTNVTNGGDALPIMTHPYKFSGDAGWVGISHCAVWDDGHGNWYYASQGRFPNDYPVNTNWAPNAVMLGHVRRILWTPSGWPVVLPERYAAVPEVAITESELVGEWENISLTYSYGNQDTSVNLTLSADHKASGAIFNGMTWSFDAQTNVLTIGSNQLVVARECDWEASPRHHTLVYAGISGSRTYWGKKK